MENKTGFHHAEASQTQEALRIPSFIFEKKKNKKAQSCPKRCGQDTELLASEDGEATAEPTRHQPRSTDP